MCTFACCFAFFLLLNLLQGPSAVKHFELDEKLEQPIVLTSEGVVRRPACHLESE